MPDPQLDSQHIRSIKHPFIGRNNSIGTEYSSDPGNEVFDRVSSYAHEPEGKSSEKETFVRPLNINPQESYRHTSYQTVREDIGESVPDVLQSPTAIQDSSSRKKNRIEKFDGEGDWSMDPTVMFIIFITLVVTALIVYKGYGYLQQKRIKAADEEAAQIEREYRELQRP